MAGEKVMELFETYRDRIERYIRSMVRDPGEAEDLTQETFLRAHKKQESLRDPEAVRGWLYSIATHVTVDRLRQRAPHVSLDSPEAAGVAETAAHCGPSALEMAERGETSACVHRCLNALSDSYRAVILLHDLYSFTSEEIAGILGIEVGAVKIRIHRARRRLQQTMEYGCQVSSDRSGKPVCEPKCGV